MNALVRDILGDAERLGWQIVGYAGNGHLRLHHPDAGVTFVTGATQSDSRRGRQNTVAELERLCGRKLPRQRSGHHPHHRQPSSDWHKPPIERDYCARVDELVAEAGRLRAEFAGLAAAGDRDAAADGRQVLRAYEAVRRQAARLHRIIQPID